MGGEIAGDQFAGFGPLLLGECAPTAFVLELLLVDFAGSGVSLHPAVVGGVARLILVVLAVGIAPASAAPLLFFDLLDQFIERGNDFILLLLDLFARAT